MSEDWTEVRDEFTASLMREVMSLREALIAEQKRSGGAAATHFDGKLILTHPDMPAHVWDGEKMEPITFDVIR